MTKINKMRLELTVPQFIMLYELASNNKDVPELNELYELLMDKYYRLKENEAFTLSKTAKSEEERATALKEYYRLREEHRSI